MEPKSSVPVADADRPIVWHRLHIIGAGSHCSIRLTNVTLRSGFVCYSASGSITHSRVELVNVNVNPGALIANVPNIVGGALSGTLTLTPSPNVTVVGVGSVLENTTFSWYGLGGGNIWNKWGVPGLASADGGSGIADSAEERMDRTASEGNLVRFQQVRVEFRRVAGAGASVVLQSIIASVQQPPEYEGPTSSKAMIAFFDVSDGASVVMSNVAATQNTTDARNILLNVVKVERSLVLIDSCWFASRAVNGGRRTVSITAQRAAVTVPSSPPSSVADLTFLPFYNSMSDTTRALLLNVVPATTLQEDAATLVVVRQSLIQLDAVNDTASELMVALLLYATGSGTAPTGSAQFSGPSFVVAGVNTTVATDSGRSLLFVSRLAECTLLIAGNATAVTGTGTGSTTASTSVPSLFFNDLRLIQSGDDRHTFPSPALLLTDTSEWGAQQTAPFGPSKHSVVARVSNGADAERAALSTDIGSVKNIWIIGNDGRSEVYPTAGATYSENNKAFLGQAPTPSSVADWTTDAFVRAARFDSVVNASWPAVLSPSWAADVEAPLDAPAKGRSICGVTFELAIRGLSFLSLHSALAQITVGSFILDSVDVTLGANAEPHASSGHGASVMSVKSDVEIETALSVRRIAFTPGEALTNTGWDIAMGVTDTFRSLVANETSSPSSPEDPSFYFGFPNPNQKVGPTGSNRGEENRTTVSVTGHAVGLRTMGSISIAGQVDRLTQVLFTSSFLSFQVSAASAAAISAAIKNVRGGLTIGNNIFAIEGARTTAAVFFSSLDVVQTLRISNNEIVLAAATEAKGVYLGHSTGGLEISNVVIEANFITAAAPQAFGLFMRSPFRKTRPSMAGSLRLSITLNDTFIAARTLWVPSVSAVTGSRVPAAFAVIIGGDVVQTDLQLRVRRCRLEASDSFMIAPRIAAIDLQLRITAQYGRVYASVVDTALIANATKHIGEDAAIIPKVPISNAAISASSVVIGERKENFNFSVLNDPMAEEMRTPTRQAVGVAANLPVTFGPSTRVHYVAVEACKFTVVADSLPCGICVHSWSGPTGVVVARNTSFLIADGLNAASLGFVDPTKTPATPLSSHAAASSSNDRRDALVSIPRRLLMNETHMRRFLFEPRITDLATRGVAGAIQFLQSAALDSIDIRECNATVLVSTSPDFFPLFREDETEAMLSAATVPSPLPSEMPFELAPTIGWDKNGPRYLPRRPSWDASNLKGSAAFLHAVEGRTLIISSSAVVMDSAIRVSCGVLGNCFGVAFRGPVEMSVSSGQGMSISLTNMSIHHDSFGGDFDADDPVDEGGKKSEGTPSTSHNRVRGGRWRMQSKPPVTPAQNAERSNFAFARPVKAITSAVLFNATSQDTSTGSKRIRLDVFNVKIEMRTATASSPPPTDPSTSPTSPTAKNYESAEQRAARVGLYSAQSPLGEFGSFRPSVVDPTDTSSPGIITGSITTEDEADGQTRRAVSLDAKLVPVRRDVVGVALFDSTLELLVQRVSVEIVAESGVHLHMDGNRTSTTPSTTASAGAVGGAAAAALPKPNVTFSVVLELCHTVAGFLITGPGPASNFGVQLNTAIVYAAAPRLNQLIRRPLCDGPGASTRDAVADAEKAKAPWSYDGIVATTLRRQAAGVMIDYHNLRFVFAFENGVLTVAGADMPRCTGLAFSARSPLSLPNQLVHSRLLVDSTALDVRSFTGVAVGVAAESAIGMTDIQLARFTKFNVYGVAAAVGALTRVFAFGSLTSRVYVSVQPGKVTSLVGPATLAVVDQPLAAQAFIHNTESRGGSFDPNFGANVERTTVNVSGALAICGDENAAKAICLLGFCDSDVLPARIDFDALLQHCAAVASTSIDTANAIANAAVSNGLSANNLPEDPAPSTIVSFSLREFVAADPEASLPSGTSDGHTVKRVLSFTTAVVTSESSLSHSVVDLRTDVKTLADIVSLPTDYVAFEEDALISRGLLNISRSVGARSFELVTDPSKQPRTAFTHRPAPLIAASIVQQFAHAIRINRAIVRLSLGSALIDTLLFASGPKSIVPKRLSSTCTPMLKRTREMTTTTTGESAQQAQAQTMDANDGRSLIIPTCLGDRSHAPDARYCHPYSVTFVTASSVMTDVNSVDSQLTSVLPISCAVVGSLLTVGTVRRPTGSDIPTVKVSSSRGVFLIGGAVRLLAIHGSTVKDRLVSVTTSAMQTVAPVHQASVLLSTESWASNMTGSAADVVAEIERMSPLSLAQVNTFTSTASAHSQESVITGMASLLKLFPAVWLRGEEESAGPSPVLPPPHINGSAPSALVIPRSLTAIMLVAPPVASAVSSSSSPRTPASILAAAPVTNVSLYDANFTATFANIVTPTALRVLPNGDAENITVTILAAPTTRGVVTPSDFRSTPRSTAVVSTFRDQPSYALLRAQKLWGSPSTALPAAVVERNGGWVIGSTVLLRYQVKGAMPDTARRLVHVTPATNDQMPAIDSSPSPSSSSPSNSTPWLGGLKLTCVVLEDELPPFAPDLSFGTGRAAPASASVVVPCVDVCSNQRFAPFLKQCVGSNTATKTVSATPTAVVVPVTPAPVKVLTTVGTAVATGATIAVASIGAVGVAANVGRVTFLAALMECDGGLETDEELPIQSHPARIAMGSEDDPLRYHVGAVVCNIAIPAAMAASWIAVLFVWCRVTGKFIASSSDEELSVKGSGGRANRDKLNRSPPPQLRKATAKSVGGERNDNESGMFSRSALTLVLSYARLPSLLFVPYMLLIQPTLSSALLLVMDASDPFIRFTAVAVLVAIAASVVWSVWALAFAPFPAVFVPTAVIESAAPKADGAADSRDRSAAATPLPQSALLLRFQAAATWLLEPVGEWIDLFPDGTISDRTFVQRHFLMVADYTGRWRWFIVVEVALNAVLAVVEATATESSCTAAAWITTVLSVAYVAVVLWCRPHESAFNFYFTLFLGGANAVAAVLATVHQHARSDSLVTVVEVFLRVALYSSSLRLAYDIARVVLQLLHRSARDTRRLLRRAAKLVAGALDRRMMSEADAGALTALYGAKGAEVDTDDDAPPAGGEQSAGIEDGRLEPLLPPGPCPSGHSEPRRPSTGGARAAHHGGGERLLPRYVPTWTFQPERYRRNMERLTAGAGGAHDTAVDGPRYHHGAHGDGGDGSHGGGGARGDAGGRNDGGGEGQVAGGGTAVAVEALMDDLVRARGREEQRRARVARLTAESEARALQYAALTAEQTAQHSRSSQ